MWSPERVRRRRVLVPRRYTFQYFPLTRGAAEKTLGASPFSRPASMYPLQGRSGTMGAALFSPSPRLEVHNLRTLIPRRAGEARNQGREETGHDHGPTSAAGWPRFDAVRVPPDLTQRDRPCGIGALSPFEGVLGAPTGQTRGRTSVRSDVKVSVPGCVRQIACVPFCDRCRSRSNCAVSRCSRAFRRARAARGRSPLLAQYDASFSNRAAMRSALAGIREEHRQKALRTFARIERPTTL